MGAVYAVDDDVLDRRVAVKVLASHLAEDPSSRERFVREARAAARLSGHPNVIQVYDVGIHEGVPFMVMELLEGGALSQRVREGRPGLEQAVGWLRETASALDFGHDQGIVHRDVKPSNLLLDDDDVVHVADFGIARIATDETLTGTGQILGTAAYLSPEQVLGRSATAASDNYALAVVAFELITGTRPFRGGALAAQARQHVETDPPDATSVRADLPKALDPVLNRGLAKDPGERWPTAGAFVDALADGLQEPTRPTTPVTARAPRRATPPPPPPPPAPVPDRTPSAAADEGPPHRRRRGPLAIAALAAILLALGAAIALSDPGGGDSGSPQASSTPKKTTSTKKKKPAATPTPQPAPTASTPTASTPTTTTRTTSSSGASASALESQGHAKLAAGDAAGAIPLLTAALKATGRSTGECIHPSGSCLTYAFALFDLGRAPTTVGQPAGRRRHAARPAADRRPAGDRPARARSRRAGGGRRVIVRQGEEEAAARQEEGLTDRPSTDRHSVDRSHRFHTGSHPGLVHPSARVLGHGGHVVWGTTPTATRRAVA